MSPAFHKVSLPVLMSCYDCCDARVETTCTWLWRKRTEHAGHGRRARITHKQTTNTQYTVFFFISACVHHFAHKHTHTHTPTKIQVRCKKNTKHAGLKRHRSLERTYFCLSRASRVLLLRFCRLEGGMEWTEELFLLEEWEEWDEWDKLVRDWPALWSNCMRQKIRSVGTSSNSYGGFVITYLPRKKQMFAEINIPWRSWEGNK